MCAKLLKISNTTPVTHTQKIMHRRNCSFPYLKQLANVMPVNPLGMPSIRMKEKTGEITDNIVMMHRKNAEKRICEDAGQLSGTTEKASPAAILEMCIIPVLIESEHSETPVCGHNFVMLTLAAGLGSG